MTFVVAVSRETDHVAPRACPMCQDHGQTVELVVSSVALKSISTS